MLPLPSFTLHQPSNFSELTAALTTPNERKKIIAGGTDLLPNLKHGLYDIDALISLKKLQELRHMQCQEDSLELGALITLDHIAAHAGIAQMYPAIALSAEQIASPQIRNMATVGGNICLDTRCLYFNQSEMWRSSLGYCLKKDGTACHVVKTGKRCVAAASNDLATALLAYDAQITLFGPHTTSTMQLNDFYNANGVKNNCLEPDQIVVGVTVKRLPGSKSGFYKLRHRNSIDFSLINAAVCVRVHESKQLQSGRLVLNALVAKPKVIDLSAFAGSFIDSSLIQNIAQFAAQKCHPQSNICDDPKWRKEMIVHCVIRAFHAALAGN